MRKRSVLFALVAATALTLASSAIPGHAAVNYPDIDGCTAGCTVAAAGWPFPYLADHPGRTPQGTASLSQAVFDDDHVLWPSLVATWLAWMALVGALTWLGSRRRKPQKRRRL